jgi:hypothetical protein
MYRSFANALLVCHAVLTGTRTMSSCVCPSRRQRHTTNTAATTGTLSDFADIATASGKEFLFHPLDETFFGVGTSFFVFATWVKTRGLRVFEKFLNKNRGRLPNKGLSKHISTIHIAIQGGRGARRAGGLVFKNTGLVSDSSLQSASHVALRHHDRRTCCGTRECLSHDGLG